MATDPVEWAWASPIEFHIEEFLMTYSSRMVTGFLLLVSLLALPAESNALNVAGVFGDHMVVQAGKPIPVWGWAKPGTAVTVKLLDAKAVTATAGKDGRWMATVSPVKTGQTGTMTVSAGEKKIVAKDVLVGEVWLCSGQSNMSQSVGGSNNPKEEAAAANYPQIRMFTVSSASAIEPRQDVNGQWEVCSPKTVGHFSAVGYFFGREIHKQLKVPVGLIHSSVGATPVENWMPIDGMKGNALCEDLVRWHEDVATAHRASDKKREALREEFAKRSKAHKDLLRKIYLDSRGSPTKKEYPNKGFEQGLAKPGYQDTSWKTMTLPSRWELAVRKMSRLDGVVWFRRTVTVPAAWAGKDLSLKVGVIDDEDITYFNGEKVGETLGATNSPYRVQRDYTVPGKLVKAGQNTIAVRVVDWGNRGGISGGEMSVSLKDAADKPANLAGVWKYRVTVPVQPLPPPHNPLIVNHKTPSALYNAMIYPLAPYPIQGAIWYQGENNQGRSQQYAFLFPQLIRDWRSLWNDDELSFFYVELASFRERDAQPGVNNWWALLRAAQRKALELPRTGMATAIDIGDAKDIHPRNKQDVGKRLALSALGVEYGKKILHKGPSLKSATSKGETVTLVFQDVGEGLKATTPLEKCFGVKDVDGQWIWADAKIVGKDKVVLKGKAGTEYVAINYAWANNPAAPLYNSAGIPAVPFHTEAQKQK
jgi:sialate O-acetylesterase